MMIQLEVMYVDQQGRNRVSDFCLARLSNHCLTYDMQFIPKEWILPELKAVINKWQTFKRDEGFWNAIYIQNHDRARCVSRFGNDSDKWRWESAKVLAMLEIAQTGTLYVYQGEETGMKNLPQDWGIEEYQDVATINYYDRYVLTCHLRRK
jgi:oligo-1,6-glucosidase